MATAQMDRVIRHLRRDVLRQDAAGRTDGQLLTSFIDHKDEMAFEALVRRHGPMVFGVCRRVAHNHHDAEDAFQATFLVLARKASSIQPRERVVNWLHGVALRTARKASALAAKRRGREKQVTQMPEPETTQQDPWRDLQPLLDQELNGLPEKYRLPILLCDLQGKTIKEATRQLNWPQGTLAGRLARGRKLLAKRLANRLMLVGGSLPVFMSQRAALASVPNSLLRSTVKAVATNAGQATVAGVVPARVAILTEGVLKAMFLNKIKMATAGWLLVALLCCAVGAVYQTQAAEQPKQQRKNSTVMGVATPQEIRPPQAPDQREYVIRTRLLKGSADQPKEVLHLPKMTLEDGQRLPFPMHITDGPKNLLGKVEDGEQIKVGTFFDVRVTRLRENKVRLFCSFQKHEIEESSVGKVGVVGNSVQTLQVIELGKPVRIVFQKAPRGSAHRWIEITVNEQ